MPKKPVVFLTFANDYKDRFLKALLPEQAAIQHQLAKYQSSGWGIYHSIGSSKPSSLLRDLNRFKGQLVVFHYAGHADGKGLKLNNENGENILLSGINLTSILKDEIRANLKLIVLNACQTKGMLLDFLKLGIPAIIVSDKEISDLDAKKFAEAFYRSLVAGNSLETAFSHGKAIVEPNSTDNRIFRGFVVEKKNENGDEFPWGLYILDEDVLEWRLVNKTSHFSLPEIPPKYYEQLPIEPFRGILPFRREHAAIFFGREEEITQLYYQVKNIYPIIFYYGQSGVGKSSLLEAGLIPRLENEYQVKYSKRKDGGILFTLKELLGATKENGVQQKWNQIENDNKPLVIILDQVEEAFTNSSKILAENEIRALFGVLAACFDSDFGIPMGKIIISFRKEFQPEFKAKAEEYMLPYTEIFLERLSRKGIQQAVKGIQDNLYTGKKYSICIEVTPEEDLSEIITHDLYADTDSSVAIVLQILLLRMWRYSEDGFLTISTYFQLKADGFLLKDFFERCLREVSELHFEYFHNGLVFDILNLFTTNFGTARQVNRTSIFDRYDIPKSVLSEILTCLEKVRLIYYVDTDHRKLIHDRLAPLVQEAYLESDKIGQRALRILENKKLDDSSSFLEEYDLRTVELGLKGTRSLESWEIELLESSRLERARKEKIRNRTRKIFVTGAFSLAIFALLAGLFGVNSRRNQVEAEALALGSLALLTEQTNPTYAIRMAEAAYKRINKPSYESEQNLSTLGQRAKERPWFSKKLKSSNDIRAVDFSPDGSRILTGGNDGAILWDANGNLLKEYHGHNHWVIEACFSPSGDEFLTGSLDGKAILWNVDGRIVATFEGHGGRELDAISFTPDGEKILTGGRDGNIVLWDRGGNILKVFEGHSGEVLSIDVSSNGQNVISGSSDFSLILWNLEGQIQNRFIYHSSIVCSVDFSPNGNLFLSGDADGKVILWDLSGEILIEFYGDNFWTNSVKFAPDGNSILTSGFDNTASLWSLDGEKQLTLNGHTDRIMSAGFSPDGQKMITGSLDETAIIWNFDDLPWQLIGKHQNEITSISYSPDGNKILTGAQDSLAILWDLIDGSKIIFKGHNGAVNHAVFSPDGKLILTGSDDSTAILWRINGDIIRTFEKKLGAVSSVVFSPNGDKLITASADSSIILWDISGNEISSIRAFSKSNSNIVFSQDGSQIIIAGENLMFWDFEEHNISLIDTLLGAIVRFYPNKNFFLSSGAPGGRMINKRNFTGNKINSYQWHGESISSLDISHDGEYFISAGGFDKSAIIWDTQGRIIQKFGVNADYINCIAFSPNGKTIAIASEDYSTGTSSIKIWLTSKGILEKLNSEDIYELSAEENLELGIGKEKGFFNIF